MTFLKRILTGLYAAFILYISLIMILGEYGAAEQKRLHEYRELLTGNLEELEKINANLEDKADSLRKESETLQIYARKLDFYQSNEGVVLYDGWKPESSPYAMGRMLSWKRVTGENAPLFRFLSLSFGIITYLLLTLFFPVEKNTSFFRRS